MATTKILKHSCDRCGTYIEMEVGGIEDPYGSSGRFPSNWQHIHLGQTGATIDLCDECNENLSMFLSEKGAVDMDLATHNKREVL